MLIEFFLIFFFNHFKSGEDDGVDLNRNYGYKFGFDESGSSSIACAEDYRGPSRK